jgi:hypothetical protein
MLMVKKGLSDVKNTATETLLIYDYDLTLSESIVVCLHFFL